MGDYYESEVEPIIGTDFSMKKQTSNKSNVSVYYSCESCKKKGRIQKKCCGQPRVKCYNL